MFHDTCLPWLRSITGIELTNTIDMTCSKYEYTGQPNALHTYTPYHLTVGHTHIDLAVYYGDRVVCDLVRIVSDVLLCHDDELEGRRIAFIFYLVPDWTDSDGGESGALHCPSDVQSLSVNALLRPNLQEHLTYLALMVSCAVMC